MLFLSNPAGIDDEMQKDSLDAIKKLNEKRLGVVGDPEIAARISSYEMAGRMQSSAPELMDLSKEIAEDARHVRRRTGQAELSRTTACSPGGSSSAASASSNSSTKPGTITAGSTSGLKTECGKTDQASAALVKDLKQRGLLDDTLVIWGGEFGRTPMVQGGDDGRDHHPNCYSVWMAGGGVKPGLVLGKSDELGFNAVEDRVHVHDLNATILHLLGIDHTKLTFRSQGRDFRLTDVHGIVVEKLLA